MHRITGEPHEMVYIFCEIAPFLESSLPQNQHHVPSGEHAIGSRREFQSLSNRVHRPTLQYEEAGLRASVAEDF